MSTPLASQGTTRRERLRADLIAEIKAVAIAQLEAAGPAGVSLRGIAREVGVSPAALYGYFDSLDDAVHRADRRRLQRPRRRRRVRGGGPAARRPRRTPLGRHPGVPGMGARQPVVVPPPLLQPRARLRAAGRRRGPHRRAARASSRCSRRCSKATNAGSMKPPPSGPHIDTSKFREHFGLDLTPDQLAAATKCWTEFHGFVALGDQRPHRSTLGRCRRAVRRERPVVDPRDGPRPRRRLSR